MKKVMSVALCFAFFSGAACASTEEVLSIQTVREGNVSVALPTVKLADGSICVSYLSSASRDEKSGKLVTEVSQVCGQPTSPGATTPANLKAMGSFASGDLTVQTPTLAANVTPETACSKNGLLSTQGDGSLVYCKDHKWTANRPDAS